MSSTSGRNTPIKDEKQERELIVDTSKPSVNYSHGEVDNAWKYLDQHRDDAKVDAQIDLAKLRRKIDLRIVPLMFLCYTLQFLDKVILNVSCHCSKHGVKSKG